MKKFLTLAIAIVAAMVLVACSPKVDEAHDYFLTGNMMGWGDVTAKPEFAMTAVKKNDERLSSIKDQLKDAEYIYVLEHAYTNGAGWEVKYTIDGKEVVVDGNLAVKIIKAVKGEEAPTWWGQSPESGKFTNLTPSTLYIPPFMEENVNGAGGWNDNPMLYKPGKYVMVYVQYSATQHGLAAIAITK